MACEEKTEVRLEEEEPTSVEMKPEVADEEVSSEDAEVTAVGGPKKRRRDRRHLAAGSRQKKEQNRTQRKDGCRNNLVAASRAAVAWRRIILFRKILTHGYCGLRKEVTAAGMMITRYAGHGRKRRNRDDAERETRKGRTEENRRRKDLQCKTGIKNPTKNNSEGWNLRERAPLGSGGTRKKDICDISKAKIMVTTRIGKEVFERTTRLGIPKRSAGSPVALRMIKKWTQWRGKTPPKRKKEQEAEEEPVM
jgi:hypothetical protein